MAYQELKEIFDGKFGSAGSKVVIEDFLRGIELSVFVLTDGSSYVILPEAKDYKRIGEGDTGLNTGGMGAVSPVPFAGEEFLRKVEESIVIPTMRGLKEEGIDYKGFIFIGLMNVEGEPYVIEYNVRMGDPEAEVVIPRIKSDLLEVFKFVGEGELKGKQLEIDDRTVTTVMLVSGGYPEAYQKGYKISGLEDVEDSIVFHAGTKTESGNVLTNGGRVLAVSSFGTDFREALEISYKNTSIISFKDMYFRRDIGFDL
jgi:phosphoribosylamine--glycine ligase